MDIYSFSEGFPFERIAPKPISARVARQRHARTVASHADIWAAKIAESLDFGSPSTRHLRRAARVQVGARLIGSPVPKWAQVPPSTQVVLDVVESFVTALEPFDGEPAVPNAVLRELAAVPGAHGEVAKLLASFFRHDVLGTRGTAAQRVRSVLNAPELIA